MMNIYLPFLYIVTIVATLLLLYLDPVRIAKHLYRKLTPGAANKNSLRPQDSKIKHHAMSYLADIMLVIILVIVSLVVDSKSLTN